MIHLEVYHEADLTSMFVKSVLSVIWQTLFFSDFVNAVTHSARWPISQLAHQPEYSHVSKSGLSARVAHRGTIRAIQPFGGFNQMDLCIVWVPADWHKTDRVRNQVLKHPV